MSTLSHASPEMNMSGTGRVKTTPTRPLYYSVRREVWENRGLYIGPIIGAIIGVFGLLVHGWLKPHAMPAWMEMVPGQPSSHMPVNAASMFILAMGFIVGVFYCLDSLHGERRDRSILFWKSMPVSDTTAVLAKLCTALVVLPAIVWLVIVGTLWFMLAINTAYLLASGGDVGELWRSYSPVGRPATLLYSLATQALWQAPIFAWLLLASSWAKRAPFVWAVFPIFGALFLESMLIGSSFMHRQVVLRIFGSDALAFNVPVEHAMHNADAVMHITPGRFFTAPGLWIGLVLAAVFIAAAVRLRRYRDPI
jgi:ABC-2 type transport system permease protein